MGFKTVFKRYELKYMITKEQKEEILKALSPYMTIDEYGRITIRNIYFDTDDYILARHSIAKPDFKEKLRIRSYSKADDDSTVFVELKRKYDGVVYKRRVALTEHEAKDWVHGLKTPDIHHKEPQKTKEIDYFFNMYDGLHPALYLSYERVAMYGIEDDSVRITFDSNIFYRDHTLDLSRGAWGKELLNKGERIMEIKIAGSMPMWLVKILDELNSIVEQYCQADKIQFMDIYSEQLKQLEAELSRLNERHSSAKGRLLAMYKDKLDGVISDDEAIFPDQRTE